jgi:two-component sensor histidine kinase
MKNTKKPGKTGKRARAKEPKRDRLALIEQKLYERHTVRFPQMKGRVVENIDFFTMENHHDLTIEFQDKMALYLKIDPCYNLQAILAKRTRDGDQVIHAWPSISLEA